MIKPSLFVLATVVALAGCSMRTPYERPAAPVPAAWPAVSAAPDDGAVPVDAGIAANQLPWRDYYGDERLQTLIQTALDNNTDLRLATLNVVRARALYGIQRSALYPALDADAGLSRQRTPADLSASGATTTSSRYAVNLGVLAWEIDFFGRIRSLKDQALESYLATEQAHRSTRILIIASVAGAYLNLAADRENLALAETTLAAQQAAYDLIERRYRSGLGTELDLSRAQTQVDTARGEVARYTQRAAQDENALRLLLGTPDDIDPAGLPVDLVGIAPPALPYAGVPSDVLLARPDILAAEHRLKASQANIDAARAALFPRITLTTTIGTASSQLSGLFESGSGTWLLAPKLQVPIFDARLTAAVDAAHAEREIALVQYEMAIQTAFREVADALVVSATIDRRLAAQRDLVQAAEKTYRLSDARYRKGVDNYLGVLDAQRFLFGAQQGLVALKLAKLVNQVQLYASLGGGVR